VFVKGMCLTVKGDGSMKDYREFTKNERESIDDICIEIHKDRLMRSGICVSMHHYDNVGLWFKFDNDPYYAYPKTLEKAIEAFVRKKPVELINVNYDDSYPNYSDEDIFKKIEEIQEYETDMVLHNVKQILYYLYIGDLEIIKTALDDIDYSYQRGIDYDEEIKTLKEIVKEYTS
jgi:hypothetical protein